MPKQPRQMAMVAFLQAQNCSNLPGSWRHPASMPDMMSPDYYQRIARVLEDGKFHMAFFDDRWPCPTSTATIFAIPSRMACAR
jgi:alkanesulfonate monooxygenase SsuD/methylene tetrahydromethanopterin reductase-like flavin-dependent oxidoreductase (luciferase family)